MKTVNKIRITFLSIILLGLTFAVLRSGAGVEVAKAVTSLLSVIVFTFLFVTVYRFNDGGASNAIHR